MSIGAPTYRDSNIETLSGGKTLTVGDAWSQTLDPGGAGRTVVLPAEAKGLEVYISNAADASLRSTTMVGLALSRFRRTRMPICPVMGPIGIPYCRRARHRRRTVGVGAGNGPHLTTSPHCYGTQNRTHHLVTVAEYRWTIGQGASPTGRQRQAHHCHYQARL